MFLLNAIASALVRSSPIAFGAAFLWGIASILLSPCHLGSIPLVVAVLARSPQASRARATAVAILFSLGNLIVVALIGIVTAALGRILGDLGRWPQVLVGAFLLLFGLHLIGVLPLPEIVATARKPGERYRALQPLFFGMIYGAALGPCSFAFLAPLIGIGIGGGASGSTVFTVILFTCYALGHTGVILAAALLTDALKRYLAWTGRSRAPEMFRKASGALIGIVGIIMIVTAFTGGT
jgi:cytochrome c-type biogenesis protein